MLDQWAPHMRTVPDQSTVGCCEVCFGTSRGSFPTCFKCGMKWAHHPDFDGACDLIVPCTIAVSPSPWYTALLRYKEAGGWSAKAPALAVALWAWMESHWDRVSAALGGEPTLVLVVPSTRRPMPTSLHRLVTGQPKLQTRLRQDVVAFVEDNVPNDWAKHERLIPEAFVVSRSVSGERILVIEDTWVAGAMALSTAIALRSAGADSLALVSVGRMVYEDAMTEAFRIAATAPIDFATWPR